MRFTFTDEQRALGQLAHDVLVNDLRVERPWSPALDGAAWKIACDAGLLGVAVPTEFDGSGATHVEAGIVQEQAGKTLTRLPLLTHAIAASVLSLAATDEVRDLLRRVATGRTRATVAFGSPGDLETVGRTITVDDSGVASGTDPAVPDLHCAEHVVILARRADTAIVLLRSVESAETEPSFDPRHHFGVLELDGTATVIAEGRAAATLTRHAVDVTRILAANELTGITEWCLEDTRRYVLEREQFGRPVGSFQAVKHRLADVKVALEGARSTSRYAAWCLDHEPCELPVQAPVAFSVALDAALVATAASIQLHGGLGFTWEHPAHFALKRVRSLQLLFGGADRHRAAMADVLLGAHP